MVCHVPCLIGAVGHVGEVAVSIGVALELIVSMLHGFIRRFSLDLYMAISVGGCGSRRRCGGCDRHDSIPSILVDDIACRSVDLEVGGPRSAGIVFGGVTVHPTVSQVAGGGGDFGTGILASRIPRISRGRDIGRNPILVLLMLVSSSE